MDKGTFSSVQLFYFTLCFLHSILLVTGTLSIEPQFACIGDRITINCSLSVPGPTDLFSGLDATYIIGNDDDPILPTTVNGASMSGGVDLSKLMAVSVFGNSTFLEGRLVLLSYLPEDNNIRLGCENEYRINGDSANRDFVNDTLFLKQAAPPSPPLSVSVSLTSLSAASCSGSVRVAWTPGDSDRPIDTYFLFLNGDSLTSVNSPLNSYVHSSVLATGVVYRYSVIASSCAGNSTPSSEASVTVESYSLVNTGPSSLYVNYIASNMQLTLDWSLSPVADTLLLNYSLALSYSVNYTVDEFTNSAFSLPSNASTYSVLLTPHTPVTNITACINITSQCGMAFSGEMLCGFFSSENPPTTTQPTQPTIATTSNELTSTSPSPSTNTRSTNATNVPTQGFPIAIIAGAVGGAGALLFILILILVIIMLCICCGKKSNDSKYPSRRSDDHVELAAQSQSTDNIQSEAMYTQVNKPQRGPQQSDLYSSVHKQPPQQKELLYADLDHVTSQSDRVYPPVVPHTQYTDLAQFPRADQTLYASVHTDGPN